MLRNKNYVYGSKELMVPGHINFGQYMMDKFRQYNEHTALIAADTGETMTHRQLVKLSVDIALSLVRMGVKRGDAICLLSESRLEFMPTLLGIICAGAVFLTGEMNQTSEKVLYRINVTKPKILFCSQNAYDVHKDTLKKATFVKDIIIYGNKGTGKMSFEDFLSLHDEMQNYEDFQPIPVKGWIDVALVMFSSGSTGTPKPVPMTHLNFISLYQNGLAESNPSEDLLLATRDYSYTYGLLHTVAILLTGTPVVFTARNNVEDYLSIVEKYKISTLQLVPTTLKKLIKTLDKCDVSSGENIITASMPLDSNLLEATRTSFQNLRNIIQLYGMTETSTVTMHRGLYQKMNSVGLVVVGAVLKVVDINTRQPLGPNERGEICVKSFALMSGYIGNMTLECMDDEGFYKSGDMGYYDEDKYFYIIDKIEYMFKYRGDLISPVELESILLLHPKVEEAGVASAPHELLGNVPVAFVVLIPGENISETELMDYFAERAPSLQLGGVHFVNSLPRRPSEKLERKTLNSMINSCHLISNKPSIN